MKSYIALLPTGHVILKAWDDFVILNICDPEEGGFSVKTPKPHKVGYCRPEARDFHCHFHVTDNLGEGPTK